MKDLAGWLEQEPLWKLAGGKLTRTWSFANFQSAMAFVNRVAEMAEEARHHPDIDIRYARVTLGLVTHDAGGVTEKDAEMAERLSREFPG